MKTFFYLHSSGINLEVIFKKWSDILTKYEKNDVSDLPYWYYERTNIGLLALAAFALNGYTMEEFSFRKRGANRNASNGRADLYIYIEKNKMTKRTYELNIEAKQRWCPINIKKSKHRIEAALKRASEDCECLNDKAWKSSKRLAIVFVLPYLRKVNNLTEIEMKTSLKDFEKNIKTIVQNQGVNFAAIHYADLKSSKRVYKKYPELDWCPGIAVLGKFIKK